MVHKIHRLNDDEASNDPVWQSVCSEAEEVLRTEPALGSFVFATVLGQDNLEDAIIHRLAQRLNHSDVDAGLISKTFRRVLQQQPQVATALRADISAVLDRDPACARYIEPILYFKGFHALATYRFAHALWLTGRNDFALYLQSQSSKLFSVDIHPAAQFGKGIMLDHATGFVVGETAVIGDNCSFLHGVTLGGSGKETGDRHPKIGHSVLIGAGAKVLGNIKVGCCSRIAAGSVVLKDIPQEVTVAGVPARIVGDAGCSQPSSAMDQQLNLPALDTDAP
ncbi:MAG: serine O-acetyltransferase [Alphaproteobacteria bacterium]|nr:serine O-acetyltransferase [Alphaproteobacteria bacterium]